jgi:L-cysteine/cystine lyase
MMGDTLMGVTSEAVASTIAAIRAEVPVTQTSVYLNTGTNGPLPRRSHDALVQAATHELEEGRIGPKHFPQLFETLHGATEAAAEVLGCSPEEVALTHNTTEGMNIALMGLDWQRGDEVVTSRLEHPGGLYPVLLLRQRYGVAIRMTSIGDVGGDPVAQLRQALTPRTRAVVLSHVSWATGRVLPLRELAEITHAAGALLICDAAQSAGMVPSRVYELGVDAYACSGQKWLCGPDGTGMLFVRRDRFADVQQTFIGYFGASAHDLEGHFVPPPTAMRYQVATLYPPSLTAFTTSLRWLRDEVGWPWIFERIAALGRVCYETLAAVPGVCLHTPPEAMAGLVHFTLEGIAPKDLTARLAERGILIRDLADPAVNRVSVGFYNTEEEVQRLAEALRELRAAE